MNILETKDLTYVYSDGTTALKEVSVTITQGSTTALIGGNGCGKSTLFLHLNGIYTPSQGQVFFAGQAVQYSKKALSALRSQVGIVFQNSDEQLFSASVRKDVSFGLMNMGLSPQEAQQRLDEVVASTGIAALLDKPTHALSFGQKKRVAIAGVAAMHPKVLLLDEPTAGLDPSGVQEILGLLEHLKRRYGMTIVFSTHEIDLLPLYCDKVLLMDQGKLLFSGTWQALFQQPALLRQHSLRLPRIAHLIEILKEKDGIPLAPAATIGQARKSIRQFLELYHE